MGRLTTEAGGSPGRVEPLGGSWVQEHNLYRHASLNDAQQCNAIPSRPSLLAVYWHYVCKAAWKLDRADCSLFCYITGKHCPCAWPDAAEDMCIVTWPVTASGQPLPCCCLRGVCQEAGIGARSECMSELVSCSWWLEYSRAIQMCTALSDMGRVAAGDVNTEIQLLYQLRDACKGL